MTRGADGTLNPIDPATGLPTRATSPRRSSSARSIANLRTPYVQQYNFGVQRELGANMMLEVRYVGSKGSELLEARASIRATT